MNHSIPYQNTPLWAYFAEISRKLILEEGSFDLEQYLFLRCKAFVKGVAGVYEDEELKISMNSQEDLTVWTKLKSEDDFIYIKVFSCNQGIPKIVEYSDWILDISVKIPLNCVNPIN